MSGFELPPPADAEPEALDVFPETMAVMTGGAIGPDGASPTVVIAYTLAGVPTALRLHIPAEHAGALAVSMLHAATEVNGVTTEALVAMPDEEVSATLDAILDGTFQGLNVGASDSDGPDHAHSAN